MSASEHELVLRIMLPFGVVPIPASSFLELVHRLLDPRIKTGITA